MIQLFRMAWRNLGRNRRRSFLSALALGIGLALLLLMAGILKGEMLESMRSAIQLQTGHLQIRAGSYEEAKTSLKWQDLVENPGPIATQVAALPPVQAATPRLFATGLVVARNETVGVRVIGIDPPSAANAPFRDGLVSGQFLTANDNEGLLIGQPLADKLGLKVGDRINLSVNTSNGDVDEQPFTIRGVYSTHTPGYDESTVFLPLPKAQAITQAGNHASTVFVLLKDQEQTGAVATALQAGHLQVKTWQQMNDLIIQFEQLAEGYMILLYLIVLGITATVIINTLVMSVFERTREIGILSAMGMTSRRVMALFFAESSLLAAGGILIGLVLGGLMVAYATQTGFYIGNFGATGIMLSDRIYAHLTLSDTIGLTIAAFVVTLLAALYPARMAASMDPIAALHSGL